MRQYAIRGEDGQAVVTSDLDLARQLLARVGFFSHAFGEEDQTDLEQLHRRSTVVLRAEAADWIDQPL